MVCLKKMYCCKGARQKSATTTLSAQSDAVSMTKSLGLGISGRTKQKALEWIKLLVVAVPPIAAVIYLSVMMLNQVRSQLQFSENLTSFMSKGNLLNQLVLDLQRERGMTCVYITSGEDRRIVERQLGAYRMETDTTTSRISSSWQSLIKDSSGDLSDATTFLKALQQHRGQIMDNITTCLDNMAFYTPIINNLIQNWGRIFYDSDEGKFWGCYESLRMIIASGEMLGQKRATGGTFFAQGFFTPEMHQEFVGITYTADSYLELAKMAHEEFTVFINKQTDMLRSTRLVIDHMTTLIVTNNSSGDRQQNAVNWFQNMTIYTDSLIEPTKAFINAKLYAYLDKKQSDSNTTFHTVIGAISAAIGICIPIAVYFSVQNSRMNRKIREKIKELKYEKQKSESLLYQMMPMSVVKELQAGNMVLPQTFDECTVYFSDIKGFTNISSTSTPLQVIDLLNTLYTVMDNVLDSYGCYKVETIGDAYLVVSGIPKPNRKNHSAEVCTMALHMLKEISSLCVPHRPEEKLRMRIGVNTGPCAAGIVGMKMPRYCLFGDSVNTASRMESTGMPQRIQLSESTEKHLQAHHKIKKFETQYRGQMDVKGKGKMKTYWLKSRYNFPFVVDLSLPDDDPTVDPTPIQKELEDPLPKLNQL